MIGEVMMDLVQPGFMSRIVDDGVLGLSNGGSADLHLIWMLGLQMIGLVLVGGLCGSLNNVFVHISSQNIGNEIRKDCFGRIMDFSFPQMDRFGAGSQFMPSVVFSGIFVKTACIMMRSGCSLRLPAAGITMSAHICHLMKFRFCLAASAGKLLMESGISHVVGDGRRFTA